MQSTLFQQVLRAPFFNLPDALRALHGIRGRGEYVGRATVERGRNPLSRLFGLLAGLPPAMRDAPTRVEFIADERREIWKRDFGGRKMWSTLHCRNGQLCERLGPVSFRFELHTYDGEIWWNVAKARLFGVLPLPAKWFSRVQCRERENAGRYEFRVEAVLPLVGLLVRYEGWLEPIIAGAGHPGAAISG